MPQIFAYVAHKNGVVDEGAVEFTVAARKIDAASSPIAVVTGAGADVNRACESLAGTFAEVWKIANEALAYSNAELVRQALVQVLPKGAVVLVTHDHFGIDLAPGLAVKLDAAAVSDVVGIDALQGTTLRAVRQEFGGEVSTHVSVDVSAGAVMTVRPGAFKPDQAVTATGHIVDKSAAVTKLASGRRYIETVVAESGDVDITKHDILISVGRGIQEQGNVSIAEELAEAMGAAVSCSRPVVDAKWMPKSRQVGTSGKTVKPKVYMACGISGAFQHVAGIKGSPVIIAINKNAKAPIFQVANVGIVADILEFIPMLTEKVREARGAAAK